MKLMGLFPEITAVEWHPNSSLVGAVTFCLEPFREEALIEDVTYMW